MRNIITTAGGGNLPPRPKEYTYAATLSTPALENEPPVRHIHVQSRRRQLSRFTKDLIGARYVFCKAHKLMRQLLIHLRLGNPLEPRILALVADIIVRRVTNNPHLLTGIARFKQRHEYVSMRSVSFTALLIAFAHMQGYSREQLKEIALGALLHDAGKMWVPQHLLNKQSKLTARELQRLQHHIHYSELVFMQLDKVSVAAGDVVSQHHERLDGSGYPNHLQGEDISELGQMAAIADVYDALTSPRYYRDAIEPTYAMQTLYRGRKQLFQQCLVQRFIRGLGIFPFGSIVETPEGLLGVVLEQRDDLTRPLVRVFYDLRQQIHIPHMEIDLEKRGDSDGVVIPERLPPHCISPLSVLH